MGVFQLFAPQTPPSTGNALLQTSLQKAANADPEPISHAILQFAADVAKLFPGADPRQVPASEIEQTFEIFSDNLQRMVREGWITVQEAQAGMQQAIASGTQYLQQSGLGAAAQAGIVNMTTVINNEINGTAAKFSGVPLKPAIDINAARMVYVGKTQGYDGADARIWYDKAISSAAQLTDAFLASLPARNVATGTIAGVEGAASQAVTVLSSVLGVDTSTIKTLVLIFLGVILIRKVL